MANLIVLLEKQQRLEASIVLYLLEQIHLFSKKCSLKITLLSKESRNCNCVT